MLQRAIGYIRISDPRSAERGYSTSAQMTAITEHCERQGWSLSEVLVDDGISGRLLMRPEVRRLLQLAEQRAFELLVLVKLDRSGRENRIIQEFLDQFRRRGIGVQFVEHATGDSPANRLLLNVLGGVSQFELEQIRLRTTGGRHEKAKRGLIPANVEIYGYRQVRKWEEQADPTLTAGTLVIVPEEAEVVRELFQRFAEGRSLKGEAARLNELGIRGKRGALWNLSQIRRTLENPAYHGELVWGKQSWSSYYDEETGKKRWRVEDVPPERWHRIPVPAIVERDLWERVQPKLADRTLFYPGRPSVVWPLRGCLHCGHCRRQSVHGHKVRNRRGYEQRFYACRECHNTRAARPLEKTLLGIVREHTRPGVLGAQARAEVEAERQALQGYEEITERYERDLARLDEQERGIARMIGAGIAPHIVSEQIADLHRRREQASARLQELLAQSARIEDPEAAYLRAETVAAWARELLDSEDPADLQAVFQRLVRVTLTRKSPPQVRILSR